MKSSSLAALTCVFGIVTAQQFKPYTISSLSAATHFGEPGSITPSISRLKHRQLSATPWELPYYHQVSFEAYDQQPATNTTTRCEVWWPTDATVPEWTECEDGSFEFRFEDWVGVDAFTLDIKHMYQDSSIGPPPMDYVTTWGKLDLSVPEDLDCVKGSQPLEEYCGLVKETVELLIYQAVA